jgi:hypothetical protein
VTDSESDTVARTTGGRAEAVRTVVNNGLASAVVAAPIKLGFGGGAFRGDSLTACLEEVGRGRGQRVTARRGGEATREGRSDRESHDPTVVQYVARSGVLG